MRNGLQTWLLVVGILLFVPSNINAMTIAPIRPDFEVDGINYKIIDTIVQTVRVVQSVDKYQGAVFVSETVTYSGITYSVTEIGKSAFDDCTGLTSVAIPNSVTEIGSYAFRNTTNWTGYCIWTIVAWDIRGMNQPVACQLIPVHDSSQMRHLKVVVA